MAKDLYNEEVPDSFLDNTPFKSSTGSNDVVQNIPLPSTSLEGNSAETLLSPKIIGKYVKFDPNGDFILGDYSGGAGIFWDQSAGALDIAGALTVDSIDIPDTITANSFHTDTSGNSWWGATTLGASTASILNTGEATFSNITITSANSLIQETTVLNAPIVRSFTAGQNITAYDAVYTDTGNTYSIDLESGSGQYLTRADNATLSITGNFTIELNVNIETAITGLQYGMVAKWHEDAANERSYQFIYTDDGGTPTLQLNTSVNGTASSSVKWAYTLSTSTWYHLAVVYSTTGPTATLYVNGTSQGTGTGTPAASIYNSTATFTIGTPKQGLGNYFDGLIDDVRIWNTARTGTEINNNKALELDGSETGLVAYWRLNNNLLDSTSNDQTLTNNNAATFSTTVPFAGSVNVRRSDYDTVNTLRNDFIGIAKSTVSLGGTVDVIVAGVVTGMSGLSTGAKYYTSTTTGGITTTTTSGRGVGIGVSTTELLITNLW